MSRAESIRKFVVLPGELTEADGYLTPKLSIKRNIILRDFAETIESLYADSVVTRVSRSFASSSHQIAEAGSITSVVGPASSR